MLRLSKLCLDGGEMTDDQRDAMCNMGESLGLTGGQAEDLIDEYLEEASGAAPVAVGVGKPATRTAAPVVKAPAVIAAPKPAPKPVMAPRKVSKPVISPLGAAQERQKHPSFTNAIAMEMLLVSSGQFLQGSDSPDAAEHERPRQPRRHARRVETPSGAPGKTVGRRRVEQDAGGIAVDRRRF